MPQPAVFGFQENVSLLPALVKAPSLETPGVAGHAPLVQFGLAVGVQVAERHIINVPVLVFCKRNDVPLRGSALPALAVQQHNVEPIGRQREPLGVGPLAACDEYLAKVIGGPVVAEGQQVLRLIVGIREAVPAVVITGEIEEVDVRMRGDQLQHILFGFAGGAGTVKEVAGDQDG